MNRARKRAARLAVFLESAGVVPLIRGSTYRDYCDSLLAQYLGLDLELRWYARVEGRRRLREQGVNAAAIRLIPVPAPLSIPSAMSWKQRRRLQAQCRRRMLRWPPGTLPCPRCRMAPGIPKPAYPSRQIAETIRAGTHDPSLHAYPCPSAEPGTRWHLGHRR